ncbi:MAG TPA: 2-succinyl-5-enolpyruvyl-6-hydroxy-3-cyclohexene-1-carboxylic-acid synthase [Chryseolinea sp.]|nr:2-succinyl-5-enolpyruvyl-6-hydroxy-3-cyclohexene-1-carboxylic-acid synthase [Chryseolinea sp.]
MTSRLQPIFDIAALCAKKNIRNAVLCPGSRSAPLVLAFTRHPDIKSRIFSDERSAGFIALGMAQQSKTPTALICTSGTAVYNLAPAVAEAYFSHTPLVIFTADRPSEWIAQQDGQTIHQSDIFGKHVKRSYSLPQEYEHADNKWLINRVVNEAINLALQEPKGPVHLNVPFREPLYPEAGESIVYSDNIRIIEDHHNGFHLAEEQKAFITESWKQFYNILIVAGQQPFDSNTTQALTGFFELHNIPIVGDIISNSYTIPKMVNHSDVFLGQCGESVKKTLKPDLLITFGGPVISKNLKLFLRQYRAKEHWHIQPGGDVADTFQSVTHVFNATAEVFFTFLGTLVTQETFENQKQNNYNKFWEVEERRAERSLSEFFPMKDLAEIDLVNEIIKNLPRPCNLHLANSMSVRYANYIGLACDQTGVNVFANRGTSGIDGCTSTAVGHSLLNDTTNILITGDLAFFYDRNAFWHNYPLPNLRVVLLNNHGGIIFKMIDGPGSVPEADEYFITKQTLNAKKLCEEFDFEYLKLDNRRKVKNLIKDFFDTDKRTKVMELESDIAHNKEVFESLKEKIRKSYEL